MCRTILFSETMSVFAVLIVLLSGLCARAAEDGSEGSSKMSKFPQPIRSDADLINWGENTGYNSIEEYEEYPHMEVKRQGAGQYPHVGRGGNYLNRAATMHRGIRAGNAMWFGPRLGRVQKRNEGERA